MKLLLSPGRGLENLVSLVAKEVRRRGMSVSARCKNCGKKVGDLEEAAKHREECQAPPEKVT